jgi:hypothetical protein
MDWRSISASHRVSSRVTAFCPRSTRTRSGSVTVPGGHWHRDKRLGNGAIGLLRDSLNNRSCSFNASAQHGGRGASRQPPGREYRKFKWPFPPAAGARTDISRHASRRAPGKRPGSRPKSIGKSVRPGKAGQRELQGKRILASQDMEEIVVIPASFEALAFEAPF